MHRDVNARVLDIFRLNFAGDVRHNVTSSKYPDLTDLLMLQTNTLQLFSYRHPLRRSTKIPLIVLIEFIGGVHVKEFYEASQSDGG